MRPVTEPWLRLRSSVSLAISLLSFVSVGTCSRKGGVWGETKAAAYGDLALRCSREESDRRAKDLGREKLTSVWLPVP